jgi:hypothetical protein
MRLALHLSISILKKAAIVFGAVLALSAFLFLLNNYGLMSSYGPPISGRGTVRYSGIGVGSWGIVSDDGGKYLVSGDSYFPSEFQVSGLRVDFVGYVHPAGPYAVCGERVWGEDGITLTDINKIQ